MAPTSSEGDDGNSDPRRYLLKIESFSLLSTNGINKYESDVFQFNDNKWKMIIYPNGDESKDGKGHISVYLAVAETDSLAAGWEVNATFSFLIYDQLHDMPSIMRGMDGRFHSIKTEWGFSNFISHKAFKEPSNGFLVNDTCIFGVDVYVIKNRRAGECISLVNDAKPYKHEWRISRFTDLNDLLYPTEFTVGIYKWKLKLYPTGDGSQNGKTISIFLESVDAQGFGSQKKVLAKFKISVIDQISGIAYRSKTVSIWFTDTTQSWEWSAFMALSEIRRGSLANGCIVKAEVSVLRVFNCSI